MIPCRSSVLLYAWMRGVNFVRLRAINTAWLVERRFTILSEIIVESVIDIEWVHVVSQCSRATLSYVGDRTCFSARQPRLAKRVKMPQHIIGSREVAK